MLKEIYGKHFTTHKSKNSPHCAKPLKPEEETSSYRAIAGSSLILKQFEKTVLEVWGSLLQSDGLQFGYKIGASTMQCT